MRAMGAYRVAMPRPSSSPSSRRTATTTIAGVEVPVDKRLLLAIVAALVLFAVVGGVYLGLGAGQGSPVKQDAASDAVSAGAPDLGASSQMELMTGKSALGGSSAVAPTEPGAIVAPGGVELQRQDPVATAAPAADPMASDASAAEGEAPVDGGVTPADENPASAPLAEPAAEPASH